MLDLKLNDPYFLESPNASVLAEKYCYFVHRCRRMGYGTGISYSPRQSTHATFDDLVADCALVLYRRCEPKVFDTIMDATERYPNTGTAVMALLAFPVAEAYVNDFKDVSIIIEMVEQYCLYNGIDLVITDNYVDVMMELNSYMDNVPKDNTFSFMTKFISAERFGK